MRRRHKYSAQPTAMDGIRFASKAEARRYAELKLLAKAGEIGQLVLQPRFPLAVDGQTIGHYVADFGYVRSRDAAYVVEDVKGVRTAMYAWKRKHMQAQYGIEIVEVAP